MFTYAVGKAPEGDAKLVLTITDDARTAGAAARAAEDRGLESGDLESARRAASGEGRGGADGSGRGAGGRGAGGAADAAGAQGAGAEPGGWCWSALAEPAVAAATEQPAFAGIRGRGGPQAPLVAPGRYRATLGRLTGETVTPIGSAQSVSGDRAAAVRSAHRGIYVAQACAGDRRPPPPAPSALIAVIASAIIEPTSATLAGSTSVLLFFASSPN